MWMFSILSWEGQFAGMQERGPSAIFIEQKPAWEVLEHSEFEVNSFQK